LTGLTGLTVSKTWSGGFDDPMGLARIYDEALSTEVRIVARYLTLNVKFEVYFVVAAEVLYVEVLATELLYVCVYV